MSALFKNHLVGLLMMRLLYLLQTFSSSLSGIAIAVLGSGQISLRTRGSLISSPTDGLISMTGGSVGSGVCGVGAIGELGSWALGELGSVVRVGRLGSGTLGLRGCADSWFPLVA